MKNDDNQSRKTQPYFIEFDGQPIQVTEEVYHAYKRPRWVESKRRDRWSRCRTLNSSRCEDDCSQCPYQRSGGILSLEQSQENGFEPIDESIDVEEAVLNRLLMEQLTHYLKKLNPDNRRLCYLISQGLSERKIAALTGISQSTISYRKIKLFEELRNFLKDFL